MKLRPRSLLWLLVGFYCFAIFMALNSNGIEFDTEALIKQTRAALSCAAQGRWTGCREAGIFPLLQRIPVVFMAGLGLNDWFVVRCLVLLNLSVVIFTAAMAWKSLERRSNLGAWGFAAVLLFGPFLWYARSSFSEALAGCVSLILIIACLDGWGGAFVFGFAFLAGLSKGTAFPFLMVAGCLAFAIREPRRGIWRAAGFAQLTFGLAASLLLNIGHNFFRYGGWTNQGYLAPTHLVHDLATQANFFVAFLFSPNAGLVFFWPIAVCILAYPLTQPRSSAWIIPGCWILLFALMLGFSKWADPFGWWCWGPRFFVPWIPVLAFLALAAEPRSFDDIFARLARNSRAPSIAGALLILISFPSAEAVYSSPLKYWLFQPDSTYPTGTPVLELDPGGHSVYIRHLAWSHTSVLLEAFDPRLDPRAFGLACIVSIGMAHFLFRFRTKAKAYV